MVGEEIRVCSVVAVAVAVLARTASASASASVRNGGRRREFVCVLFFLSFFLSFFLLFLSPRDEVIATDEGKEGEREGGSSPALLLHPLPH